MFSELFDYYNEGSADGIEQIELALLLRDQEQLSNQVVTSPSKFSSRIS